MKQPTWLARHVFRRSTPHFGMLVNFVLIVACLVLACWPFQPVAGEHRPYATIIGWLPAWLLQSPAFFLSIRISLVFSATLWLFRLFTPWSCWFTAVLLMVMWSLRMENVWSGAHIYNVVNMLLVVHAMWYTFYDRDMKQAIRNGRFWRARLYPYWVYWLCVFYIGFYHSLAGVSKIAASGLGWGDGLSLQIWVHVLGDPDTWPAQMIIASRTLTRIIQSFALFLETACILAVFSRWIRIPLGLGLIGFYINVMWIFDFGFQFNLVLLALVYLPFLEVLNHYSRRWNNSLRYSSLTGLGG